MQGMTEDRTLWKKYLVGRLDGAAQAWLLGQGVAWTNWTYDELKAQLLAHFQGETTIYERKLQNLRCTGDLVKFNEEFSLLAAAAMPSMGASWVKNVYLSALFPKDVAPYLSAFRGETLQQLMAKAIEIDASLRPQRNRSLASQLP